jgi:hypothetical protein
MMAAYEHAKDQLAVLITELLGLGSYERRFEQHYGELERNDKFGR